ncbi:hypothetical protein MTO96_018016 [Rhipicephalus appendiculatus]
MERSTSPGMKRARFDFGYGYSEAMGLFTAEDTERSQDPTIYYDLPVSLEEVFSGCTKQMTITRTVMGPDGRTPKLDTKTFDIDVKPGWNGGTEALRGTTLGVPALTHDTILVPLTDFVKPTTVKRIPGEGLPYPGDPTIRGDLLLGFDIEYPRHMTATELEVLWNVLTMGLFTDEDTERSQDPTIYYDLPLSLDEVYSGCTKKMKITRTVMGPGGRTPKLETKTFNIKVKPADVVFVIRDKPHPQFKREGSDVRYVAKITFKEAVRGTTLEVPTLTHGTISVPLTDIVKPTTVMRIPGQGLPYPSDPLTRGDLLLGFDIEYPCRMTDTALQILWDTLDPLI